MNLGSYFVASFSTDIGKTHFVTSVVQRAFNINLSVDVIKPIITGFNESDLNSDSAKIIDALGLELNQVNLDKISPWRFDIPCSPHLLGNSINHIELMEFCLDRINQSFKNDNLLLIESAGGIMTPINYRYSFLDLVVDLAVPIIFITQNFLGSISQTRCAIEAIKSRGCKVEYIVVNDMVSGSDSMMSNDQFISDIEKFTKVQTKSIADFISDLKGLA